MLLLNLVKKKYKLLDAKEEEENKSRSSSSFKLTYFSMQIARFKIYLIENLKISIASTKLDSFAEIALYWSKKCVERIKFVDGK